MNNNDDDDDDGLIIGIVSSVGFVVALVGSYAASLFVDKFCSTNVDAAIIRRIEELNQGRPKQVPAILAAMETDERLKILNKVLDFRVRNHCYAWLWCLLQINNSFVAS